MNRVSRPYKLAYATDLAPSIPPSMTHGGVYNESERGPVFLAEEFLRDLQRTLEDIFGKGPLPQASAAGPPGIGRAPGYVYANGGGGTGGPAGSKGIEAGVRGILDIFTPYWCRFCCSSNQQAYAQCMGQSDATLPKTPELIPKAEGATAPSLASYCSKRCSQIANGRPYSPRITGTNCHCNIKSVPSISSGSGCGCKTNTGCNSMSSSSCKSCCCSSQCRKLANGRKMNPRVSGNRCFCNFSSSSGGGGGGSSTGGYVSGCGCSSTPRCNTVGGYNTCLDCCCKGQCSRLANGRKMNPRTSGRTCYCNFSSGGSSSGSGSGGCGCKTNPGCNSFGSSCKQCCCSSQCKKLANGRSYSPRVSGNTCYCNFKSSSSGGSSGSGGFKCPYSGCGSTTSKSQCFLCRCRGRCNSAKCGGVRTVKSDGSCFCNKSC